MKFLILATFLLSGFAQADVNIYTDRTVELLQPIADKFEAESGVKVNILSLSYNDIVERLEAEGENTFADLIIVKDMVYLNELTDKGVFQSFTTDEPESVVKPAMRHPENLWTAVTVRARTLVYNSENKIASDVTNYVELADERFAGKLCLRTSDSSYNVAFVSSLIHNLGYVAAQELVSGWVANLNPSSPHSNDRAVLDAVADGTCDVGVVNSYYLAGKLIEDPEFPVAITFANQSVGGVHMNGIGVGVSAYSKSPEGANDFIAFMLTDESQLYLSTSQGDYPAKIGLLPETLVRDWGLFETDAVNWSVIGLQHDNAKKLFEEVGYL
jgi:iron(III) transport system substrate-binding protein